MMPVTDMSNSPYTFRNYQPEDFDKFVRLNTEAEKLEPTERCVSSQLIVERLGRPNYSPEQDLFVVETAGNIIGYMDMVPELGIGRVILDCWIHPEHRRKGVAAKLLGYAMRRARELDAKVAHVNIPQDNVLAESVLSRLGFDYARRFFELRLDMANLPQQDVDEAALGCCQLQCGEEDKLTRIQNRSFTGAWGYNPNTVEEIIYHTNLSGHSPGDVVLACHGGEVIGYCWTEVTDEGEAAGGERKGRIFMIGTDPDYRGRGAGRKVLLAGLAHLRNKGLQVAELTVDSENQEACALYWSVGFEIRTSSLWYEKEIN